MPPSGLQVLGPTDPARRAKATPLSPSRRVLLVEDDTPVLDALREALAEEGFEVTTATDGREALDVLRRGPRPDAILLDLMMPVMDGWDFRQAQLRDPTLRDIPIVIVTATGFSRDTVHKQFGNVDLLAKPVPVLDLLAALDRLC
jgi:CheY-like chemotaxis protein